jgi:hypothetical protein
MQIRQGSKWTTLAAGDAAVVPEGQFHCFKNALSERSLVVDVRLEPSLPSDEVFFRNAYSYVEDCRQVGSGLPNPFQIALFLYEAEAIPALPGLPRWIADPIMYGLLWFVGGLIGKRLLGFRGSYTEYYDPGLATGISTERGLM